MVTLAIKIGEGLTGLIKCVILAYPDFVLQDLQIYWKLEQNYLANNCELFMKRGFFWEDSSWTWFDWTRSIGHIQLDTNQFDIDQLDTDRLDIERLDTARLGTMRNIMYVLDVN
ncbi:hypothetical protein G5I_04101 [Acromyrmex echinatior]|uniref:Uncharacterized protein n=1 Tax=Acromyrmex echinatior TaxID=103372 RepID=F4WER3_ACREC|nr:hypothetical protein G5I_04101 [Acromyrmex echinatior]